jgi:hypothetical protein
MKTKSYICKVCGENNPCILFVNEDEGAPSNCPYFEECPFWNEEQIILTTTLELPK